MIQIVTKGLIERVKRFDSMNKDLLPFAYDKRSITPPRLAITWAATCITISAFLVFGAYIEFITVFEAMIAGIIGFSFLAVIQTCLQEMGTVYGLSFPVGARLSFGAVGSQIILLLKLPGTLFWCGYDIYLGGTALNEIFKVLFHFSNLPIAMGIFACAAVFVIINCARSLNLFQRCVAPLLLIILCYVAYLLFRDSGISPIEVLGMGGNSDLPFSSKLHQFALCVSTSMAMWMGFSVSMPNITREATGDPKNFHSWWKTNKNFAFAQWGGVVPTMLILAFLGCSSAFISGQTNPIVTISETLGAESVPIMLVCQVFLCLAILSAAGGACIMPGALLLCNIFKKVNLKVMFVIFTVISIVVQPWNLGPVIVQAVGVLGGIQAPLAGIIIADYFLIRKRRIELEALFNPKGKYKYWKGFNPAGVLAYVIAAAIMMAGPLRAYGAPIGVIVSFVAYFLLMKYWVLKKYPEVKEDVNAKFPDSLEEAEANDEKINKDLGIDKETV